MSAPVALCVSQVDVKGWFALRAFFISLVVMSCAQSGGNPFPTVAHTISGTVTGAIMADVTISLGGAAMGSTTTDAYGKYSFVGLANGSYTVTPSRSGYTFSPGSLEIVLSETDVSDQNFTATEAANTHSISGAVSGAMMATVTISLGGTVVGSTTTDGSGNYTFSGLVDGSYTVTPSKSGYTFSPTSVDIALAAANVTDQNFTASGVANTYSVSGTVSGAIVAGVTISLRGGTGIISTTTDVNGNYSFTAVAEGSYELTPSKTGYTFSPGCVFIAVVGASLAGQDFTSSAVAETYSISGTVSGATAAGVEVSLSGYVTASGTGANCSIPTRSTVTDAGGNYLFAGLLSDGSYSTTPTKSGYMFLPASRTSYLSGANVTDQNFTAYSWSSFPGETTNQLNGVWGSSSSDVWAVGSSATILRWNGSDWSQVLSNTNDDLNAVWGSSGNDVWAVGSSGTLLHWNGNDWSKVASKTNEQINAIWGSSSQDVWAVGWYGTILHWNGTNWSSVPSGTVNPLNGVWGSAANDVWAVGDGGGGGVILHWNGTEWATIYPTPLGPWVVASGFFGVWGSSPDDVWAVGVGNGGSGHTWRWNGTTWSSPGAPDYLHAVWGSGANDVWAVGTFGPVHWNGNAWSSARIEATEWTTPLTSVWGSSSNDVWAVGYGGTIVRWQQ
jgi:hypothetical protein